MKFDHASKPFSATIATFGSIVSARLVSTKPPTVWQKSEENKIGCVACSLAASNPSDLVPAAYSTRNSLFLTKNLTFLAQVLSSTFFSLNEFTIKIQFYFCFADLSPEYPPPCNISQPDERKSLQSTMNESFSGKSWLLQQTFNF